jgi:hypothetical protein
MVGEHQQDLRDAEGQLGAGHYSDAHFLRHIRKFK